MGVYAYSTDKKTYERGDIFYVESVYQNEGSEQRAGRPAIIVSNNKCNENSPVVEVVYLTTRDKATLPTHVDIRSGTKPSTALCEQIDSVAKTRLGSFMASCTDSEMMNIDIALAISLGLEFGKPIEVVKEVIVEKPVNVPVPSGNGELIKAAAERDIYKSMYEDLLRKLIEK